MLETREKLEQNAEEESFTVRPMRLYEEATEVDYSKIQEGDFVIAKAEKFIPPRTIYLKVGNINAQMYVEDYDDTDEDRIFKEVYTCIGKLIAARVVSKIDGCLILERKSVARDTIDYLSSNLGIVLEATVETIAEYGLFVDIGNGIVSLLKVKELSVSRIYDNNLKNLFNIGDVIKVRLLDYDPQNSYFTVSRKQVYKKLLEEDLPKNSCFIVTCHCYVNGSKSGVYVEYDPNNGGILDIPDMYSPEEFYVGRKVVVYLRKHRDKGFCASFVRFV